MEKDKFPVRTVIILSLCMTLNSYNLVSLFPYVGIMVKGLLALETTNELGNYVGYVASSFTFGRLVGSYVSGHITDSIGRKPVIVVGLLSMVVFPLAFALSPTFGFALLSRLLLGLTNGIAPALRTTMRDVCGNQHVIEGMTYLSGCKSVSIVLGTGVGGLLAQPALNYPSLFSGTGVFGRYPFLLSNLVGSIGALVMLPIVLIYIPETRHFDDQRAARNSSRVRVAAAEALFAKERPAYGATSGPSNVTGTGGLEYQPVMGGDKGKNLQQQKDDAPDLESRETDHINNRNVATSTNELCDGDRKATKHQQKEAGVREQGGVLSIPNVKMVLFLSCVTQALVIGFEEVFPLWALSTPDVGGLGWGTIEIGKVFLATGVIVAAVQLAVFPRVIKVLNITTWQRIGCVMAVPAFVAVPYTKDVRWNERSMFVLSVASMTLVYSFMSMINGALTIASTSMVRSAWRGQLSGLFNMAGSLGRSLGPVCFALLFAWSISPSSYDWVGHRFIFLVDALSMVLVSVLAWGTITDDNTMKPQ